MKETMHSHEWFRDQPIPEEARAVALSRTESDTPEATLFRGWLDKAAARNRADILAPGLLHLPPLALRRYGIGWPLDGDRLLT